MKRWVPDFIPVQMWRKFGIPAPQQEFRFHQIRRWKCDYAWPDVKLAMEIEGGVWKIGRHNRPAGFLGDIEKYNALTEAGWRLLRYPSIGKVEYDQVARVYKGLI